MEAMTKELSSDCSSHPEGQEMLMMRMGENGIKGIWNLKEEISWNNDCELCSSSRNKRMEEMSLHLRRLQGMLYQCSISRL